MTICDFMGYSDFWSLIATLTSPVNQQRLQEVTVSSQNIVPLTMFESMMYWQEEQKNLLLLCLCMHRLIPWLSLHFSPVVTSDKQASFVVLHSCKLAELISVY